jgi:hypothetical protein
MDAVRLVQARSAAGPVGAVQGWARSGQDGFVKAK